MPVSEEALQDLTILEAPLVELCNEFDSISAALKYSLSDFQDFNRFSSLKYWPAKSGSVSKPIVLPKSSPIKRDLGYELAAALHAKADVVRERAEANSEFKARLERLQTQINMLQHDILTGQQQLPLEGEQ